jgi:hypothetical protein
LSRLSACRWQFYGLLARAGLSRLIARSHSMPSRARRSTAFSYHISGYLGQRDEPCRMAAGEEIALKIDQALLRTVLDVQIS